MDARLGGLVRIIGCQGGASTLGQPAQPRQSRHRVDAATCGRSPISSARLASALHPIGAVFLVAFGAPGIIAFALLHGAGNGMITMAKGTLPLALFGPRGYGLRSGLLSAPARMLDDLGDARRVGQ